MKKYLVTLLCIFILAAQGPYIRAQSQKYKNINKDLKSPEKIREKTHQQHGSAFISTGTEQTRQVGLDILERGGSAVDAAIASALARITVDMGCIVSFAGIFMMVYYEASTGKVHSLNGCFKTCLEETSPLTIPSSGFPNARAVFVPGFMAGIQAAHDRFGKLPFTELFEPAISIAENGFTLAPWMIEHIRNYWNVLGVLPETRDIFLKRPYGLFRSYQAGDTFTQPALANTLRQVASSGAEYMYTGAWGRNFVDLVQREGGNISLKDMEEYEVVWADPAHTTYNGYDIHALGYPSLGAMNVIVGMNLMDVSNLTDYGHCSSSADALYRLMYSSRVGEFFYLPYAPEVLQAYIPEGNYSYESRADKENARLIWEKIESGEWPAIERNIVLEGHRGSGHSEAIIAADEEGNVVAVCHTINCDDWGGSGIFVDGVSIPGAARFQQSLINKIGPGAHLPDTTNPCLVLRDGLPVVASSCIGSDLHSATVQNLYNMLNFGMTMAESRSTPKFQSIDWARDLRQKIKNNTFSQSLLDAVEAMGMRFSFVDNWPSEYWIGLRLDQ